MKVMKNVVDSYADCMIAIWKSSNQDESNENVSYFKIEDIPDAIDEKRHPKIAQRIREAQDLIAKANQAKSAKGGTVKSKDDKSAKIPKIQKTQVHKRAERTRDER